MTCPFEALADQRAPSWDCVPHNHEVDPSSSLSVQYSSCLRHHVYGGVWGQPGGESSHSSWRPYGVRSRNVQTLPSASTPRPSVKEVRYTSSPARRKAVRANASALGAGRLKLT